MLELLLDAKLWKKISESLEPSTQAFIQQNKGSGKKKFLLPVAALSIDPKKVRRGCLNKQFVRLENGYTASADLEIFVLNNHSKLMQIEQAILIEFIRLGMLGEDTRWGGKQLIKYDNAVNASIPKDVQELSAKEQKAGYTYFIRNGGLFKIGITENLIRRVNELSPDELLNVVRCVNYQDVERELHRKFKDVRLPQTEYFRLSDSQVQEVHRLMMKLANFPQ